MPRKKTPTTPAKAPKPKPAKAAPKAAKGPIYQLKITMNHVKPPVWRRVQTGDCTLAQLHDVIQASMGWHGGHLHLFEIGGEQFGLPEQWQGDFMGDGEVNDSHKVKLSQVAADGVKKLRYVYDMGDDWEHAVLIEKTVESEPGAKYPRCIDGKRACPPEDCGGAWGYGDFLNAIADPKHESHADMVEWIGGEFDPERFDLDGVNEMLRVLS